MSGIPKQLPKITLRKFAHRLVPRIDEFERQLAQRFGISSSDWSIDLMDTTKTTSNPASSRTVGQFTVDTMPGTKLLFQANQDNNPETQDDNGNRVAQVPPGFELDGKFYGITGWIAYSREPYRDDLMAGIRIYCRGKIAAQTAIFNRKAGFTGEHSVRSYLVGELHADWLDEHEDLIQTDRRDILWSHELGQSFEKWGQTVVLYIGARSREPLKKKIWEQACQIMVGVRFSWTNNQNFGSKDIPD